MTPNKREMGVWIRVSTDMQAEGDSPKHHEKRARLYAEAKEWSVKEVYDLSGVSGKSVMDHPETQRMLSDVKAGRITGLIFSKLARLARSTRELLDFADLFQKYDADLISLDESIDTSSPAGLLFYTLISAMAQWEREELAARVAASVPIRAQLGKNLGGQAIFGYQWKDGKLIPDPTEAPVRKLMYELFKEHRRKKTVARLLTEQGYRTRKGAKFSDTTVLRLLRDPTAKGLRRANYTRSSGAKKHWELKPESDWVLSEVEPIVTAELWDECNHILDEQKKAYRRPARKTVHLFAGLAFCACGHKMYVPSNSPKYICNKCRNKLPIEDLEAIYAEQLKHLFFSPDEIARHLKETNDQIRQKEELLGVLHRELEKITREMDKLYQLYLSDEITKEGFGRKNRPLENRQQEIEDELPRLQAELDVMKINMLSSDKIISEAKDLYSRWSDLSREDKRSIVETITESVVIGEDEVSINLSYIPPFVTDDNLATNPHGFMAATNWMRAG